MEMTDAWRSGATELLGSTFDEEDWGSEDEILTNHRSRLRHLCMIQQRLTKVAATSFALDDFESKWLKASPAYRQTHILEGMVRTCTMTAGMEDSRLTCEEITLLRLQKDGGRGFLALLKEFMLDDPTSLPTTPILLPNRQWDWMGVNKPSPVIRAYMDGNRNLFICEFRCQRDVDW